MLARAAAGHPENMIKTGGPTWTEHAPWERQQQQAVAEGERKYRVQQELNKTLEEKMLSHCQNMKVFSATAELRFFMGRGDAPC